MALARIIDAKAIAMALRVRVGEEVAHLKCARGLTPGLAVILVGDDPASAIYVRSKAEQSREAGMHSVVRHLAADTPQSEVVALVRALNDDPTIHGVLVQLPLPKPIDEGAVLAAMNPDKDAKARSSASFCSPMKSIAPRPRPRPPFSRPCRSAG